MLKNDTFYWTPEAEQSFVVLKTAMCNAPVLVLPDFTTTFYLETNASSTGIGVVLSQDNILVAFLSKALCPKHANLSICEKEYLAILMVVSKWRHYLEGGPFVIKTDHESLKHFLKEKLTTSIQKNGIPKLLGIDYVIQYRKRETQCSC
ncbi:hypothetical protein V6N13_037579 [Hibiscus sabdariffa]